MKDLNWYQSQFDEIYLNNLRVIHKNKNIEEAIGQSWLHLEADEVRLSMAERSDCKRLLNTWLSNTKVNGKGSKILHELK